MKFLTLLVILFFLEYHLHRNRVTTGIAGTLMNKYRTGMKEESETTEGPWTKSKDDETCIFMSIIIMIMNTVLGTQKIDSYKN